MSDTSSSSTIAFVVSQEGGLEINPADPGGVTNFGITIPILGAYLGRTATTEDIRALSLADARRVYRKCFWDAFHFDQLDAYPAVQLALFDFAVNSGPGTAIRTFQNYLCSASAPCTPDGMLGKSTLSALAKVVAATSELYVALGLTRSRRMLMARIVERETSQAVFIAGWISRTHAVDMSILSDVKPK